MQVISSKTDLEFDSDKSCYIGKGCIINITNKMLEGQVSVPFEIVDDYDCHPIIEKNKKKINFNAYAKPASERSIESRIQ